MASNRFAQRLFYFANVLPVKTFVGKGTEHVGRGACAVRNEAKKRTMASAAQELCHDEAGSGAVTGRGHSWRGERHSPLRVFDVFDSFFPNRNLRSMITRMDRLFDDPFFGHHSRLGDRAGVFLNTSRPPWDFVETEDAFRMRLDLPGLSREEVKVYVEDGNLVIKGDHNEENKQAEEEAQWNSRRNSYSTRILLPENANAEQIKAELKNGVLSVTLPKVPEQKKAVIDVAIE